MRTDLFAFKINYNDIADVNKRLYNGNISQTLWKIANTDSSLKDYEYTYDALNRITSGIDNTGNYNLTSKAYDKNGNITNLERKGHTNTGATNFGVMDDLTYSYDSGNKLMKVADAATIDQFGFKDDAVNGAADTADDYSYDTNGNLLTDANKGITSILYNYLNLPTEIKFDNSNTKKINYTYDATGVKLKKVVNDSGSLTTTDYANGYIYENNTLQFFNHVEGYTTPDGSGGFDYVYSYLDHLGNVRLNYSDLDNNGSISTSEILQENNYYPMGLKHKGYNTNIISEHKWKYNDKELQDELDLNWYDLGARNLDHALGRFMNVDPLAEQYNFQSVYTFANNNPVFFVDINGEGVDNDYGIDKNGNITLIKNTADKFDRLYVAKSDEFGEAITDENGLALKAGEENIAVNNQGILSELSKSGAEIKLTGYGNGKGRLSSIVTASESKNDLFNVFKFASDNSNAEFSLAKKDFGGTKLYNLSTYHNPDVSPGELRVVLGGTTEGSLHSHPDIQTYLDENGKIDWGLSQLKSLGKDVNNVRKHQITYPYIIYFPQTKGIMSLKFNKNSYPNVESFNEKNFKF